MTEIDRSGFDEFDRLSALVSTTRGLLDELLERGELPRGGADFLASTTLPHVERIEAGFRAWLRAEEAGLAELQYLILQAGQFRAAPPTNEAERRAADQESLIEGSRQRAVVVDERTGWDLLVLAHARLVLGLLPRVPDGAVRFPIGRRTYADIPAPRGPAELAGRIEELERELWKTATGRRVRALDPAFRRMYGFFDAAERLGRRSFGPS